MSLPVICPRGSLHHTRHALANGQLTIGFLGGSITDARPGHNWPEYVGAWFQQRFPTLRLRIENAAIGATGSESAVYRVERDILAHDCHLVFVEYAVNDHGLEATRRARSREGLLRKLLAHRHGDIVLAHTFSRPMYDDMIAGRCPASIADFEKLAEHYGIPSVWMGLHALRQVEAGRLAWQQWLPDNLHPQSHGSSIYAEAVTDYLAQELPKGTGKPTPDALPPPLDPLNWQHAHQVDLAAIELLSGPWDRRRWHKNPWIDEVLYTRAPGARLRFRVTGRTVTIGLDTGRLSADFRYRIDDGDWVRHDIERPEWAGASGWFRFLTLADDLAPGEHSCEIEVGAPAVAAPAGAEFALAAAGSVRQ